MTSLRLFFPLGLAVLSTALLVCGMFPVSGPAVQPAEVEVARQVYLMGTACQLVRYAPDRPTGLHDLEELLAVLEETEAELSTWREDSLLSRLNRHPLGQPFRLNRATCRMLKEVFFWQTDSASAFDPAIGALIDLWGIRQGRRDWPSPRQQEAALQASGLAQWDFREDRCEVVRRGPVEIDAGAFGKGEALDRVSQRVGGDWGAWLIDLGGQIKVDGRPPGRECWSIPVAHPLRRQEVLLTLCLGSGALATSGASERSYEIAGRKVNHILDPRNGRPAAFDGSVTVWHEEALAADILSTALFVMGPGPGLRWADDRGLAACFFVVAEGSPRGGIDILPSRLFREKFIP